MAGLGVWLPFLWMMVQSSALPKHRRLAYPKAEVRLEASNKPDWLYGDTN